MKKGGHRINWTDEENDFVQKHGATFSRTMLQKELNLRFGHDRSYQSVKHQCWVLGIKSEASHRSSGIQVVRWTPQEDLILKQSIGKMPLAEIASRLGRTLWSVRTRASHQGYSTKPTDRPMSISRAILMADTSRPTFLAAAKRLGVEIPFVSRVRREISDADFAKIKAHLDERKAERAKPKEPKPPKPSKPVVVKVPKEKPPKPVKMTRAETREGMELIRQRYLVFKAKKYFEYMRQFNATISQVEVIRKVGAKALIMHGQVLKSNDTGLIDEAAEKAKYRKEIRKGYIIYLP